ncbi:MAG: HmuY family protein [Candidatus Bipolaricaulis sp.]|nr:HmuY family protein [Candidatus Bipolaricaulis sp.]
MRHTKLSTVITIATLITFSACEKKASNNTDTLKPITTMVAATSYTDWVYYSLSENRVIEISDPATSTNWDIALMRSHFRTNSGTSGNGNGGAFDAGVVNFDTYIQAPETGYVVDSTIQSFNFLTMDSTEVAANTVLENWGSLSEEMPPVFTPNNKVFAIKTATGNYAKIIILSYYRTSESGNVTFKYLYQPNGSRVLE